MSSILECHFVIENKIYLIYDNITKLLVNIFRKNSLMVNIINYYDLIGPPKLHIFIS